MPKLPAQPPERGCPLESLEPKGAEKLVLNYVQGKHAISPSPEIMQRPYCATVAAYRPEMRLGHRQPTQSVGAQGTLASRERSIDEAASPTRFFQTDDAGAVCLGEASIHFDSRLGIGVASSQPYIGFRQAHFGKRASDDRPCCTE